MLSETVHTKAVSVFNVLLETLHKDQVWLEGTTYQVGDAVRGNPFKKYQKYICLQKEDGLCSFTAPNEDEKHVWAIVDKADQ